MFAQGAEQARTATDHDHDWEPYRRCACLFYLKPKANLERFSNLKETLQDHSDLPSLLCAFHPSAILSLSPSDMFVVNRFLTISISTWSLKKPSIQVSSCHLRASLPPAVPRLRGSSITTIHCLDTTLLLHLSLISKLIISQTSVHVMFLLSSNLSLGKCNWKV